jgi:capsular exopolysaccharide synthesis family protein
MNDHGEYHDYPQHQLPASFHGGGGHMAWPAHAGSGGMYDTGESGSAPRGASFTLGTIFRAIRRHWWQAALLWAITSGFLMFLAFKRITPTYSSFALLRVESPRTSILGPSMNNLSASQIKRTHMQLIKTPDVLSDAVAEYPEIVMLDELRQAASPEAIIDRKLQVLDRVDSELIEVQMTAGSPQSATDIVNAVVNSYLKQATKWANESTTTQISRLTKEKERREREVEDLRRSITKLVEELGAANPEQLRDPSRVNLEDYTRMSAELSDLEMEHIAMESRVEKLKAELNRPAEFVASTNLQDAVHEAFWSDPDVVELDEQLNAAKARLEQLDKLSRQPDAAHRDVKDRIASIKNQINVLFERRKPFLEKQFSVNGLPTSNAGLQKELRDAEYELHDLIVREETTRKAMETCKITIRNDETKAMTLGFRQADLSRSESILDTVQRALEQLQFESQGQSQISLIQKARPMGMASNDKRWKFMAMAPLGMFVAVAALCVLVEMKSGRVSNPDDLSARARLEVLGVVPPLPNPRAARKLMGGVDETRLRRQLVEYIQSIDHLRVAICTNNTGDSIRQSVLITSAFGGEGKTTLSAQLAGRCANAGLSTIVVDGDLRNPSLTRTLEAEGMPGLTNVLKGEAELEECLVRIGEGGGFHLLPTGTAPGDPSRILEGSKLGKVFKQLRENYEIVIVDTAPVLPVPDALLLGRWVQGIVLAVRYDTSRFAMIQRAYKRLSTLKVPVLGAVVNGVRNASTTYGGYGYGYGYGYGQSQAPDEEDETVQGSTGTSEIEIEVPDRRDF